MAKWMLMLLNDGKDGSGRRVLREGVVKEVFTAQNVYPGSSYSANYMRPVTPESMTTDRYSLGWKLGYYRGWGYLLLKEYFKNSHIAQRKTSSVRGSE